MRPEVKRPKNTAGMALVLVSILTAFITYEYGLPETAYYIAVALYVIGMVLIVMPDRKGK